MTGGWRRGNLCPASGTASLDARKEAGRAIASIANGRPSSEPVYIEEPPFLKWLFGSSRAAWIWLVARLWLGWEWLQAGWSKVFGGNITWKFWDWGDSTYSRSSSASA
jgi:hypothetical protein